MHIIPRNVVAIFMEGWKHRPFVIATRVELEQTVPENQLMPATAALIVIELVTSAHNIFALYAKYTCTYMS